MGTITRYWFFSRIFIAVLAAAGGMAASGCSARSGGDPSLPYGGAVLSSSALSSAKQGSKVAIGGNTACALYADGVYCWGDNTQGQVNGTTSPSSAPTKVKVDLGGDNPIDLAVGGTFACAIVNPGQRVKCWGSNASLQLGYLSVGLGPYPAGSYVTLAAGGRPLAGIQQIALGSTHGCALTALGTVFCWGDNSAFQLGAGAIPPPPTKSLALAVSGPFAPTTIAAGNYFTCAMEQFSGGGFYCWGSWAPGSPAIPPLAMPTPIGGCASQGSCDPILLASTLGISHVCWIGSGTGIPPIFGCGGFDYEGEYGNPMTPTADLPNMSIVSTISADTITALALAGRRSCAIFTGGQVQCWGVLSGACMTQTCFNPIPMPVATLTSGVTSLAVGPSSACAIQDGNLLCWGLNGSGQLGNGTTTDSPITPVTVL